MSVEIPCLPMVQEGGLEKYTKFHDPRNGDHKVSDVQEEFKKWPLSQKLEAPLMRLPLLKYLFINLLKNDHQVQEKKK